LRWLLLLFLLTYTCGNRVNTGNWLTNSVVNQTTLDRLIEKTTGASKNLMRRQSSCATTP
jgi:hypothetical protein